MGKLGEGQRLSGQERLLLIVEKPVARCVEGMSNKGLAYELKTVEANICRDLKILESRGWIERSKAHGKWRMTPKFGGFAGAISKGFQVARLRLREDEARYASEMQ
jgi:DNA-binding IclR family transcriptional regulator